MAVMASHHGHDGEEKATHARDRIKQRRSAPQWPSRPAFTAVTGLVQAITASVMAVTDALGAPCVFPSKIVVPSAIYVIPLFDKLPYDMYNYS